MKEYIVRAMAQETIDSFDAHNAPELVRCKDCKYYDYFSEQCRNGIDGIMTPNFYCANGEAKE